MKPPFRADHVGSLLRPRELHEVRARHKKGEIDRAALRAVEDKCIKEAVKLQEDVGLQAVTDGEFRRDWWHIDFIHGFDGVDLTVNRFATFQGTDEQPPLFKLTGKVRSEEHTSELQSHVNLVCRLLLEKKKKKKKRVTHKQTKQVTKQQA